MKQCPKCHKEVKDHDKYCPHCGNKLKSSKDFQFMGIVIFGLIMIILPIYIVFSSGDSELYLYKLSSTTSLKDVITVETISAVKTYHDIDEFQEQFDNVGEYVDIITNFEKNLNDQYSLSAQDKEYTIIVYNNYNVYFQVDYTYVLDDHNTLEIEKYFSRTSDGSECYEFIQTDIDSLSDIKINDLYNKIINDDKMNTLYDNLLDREEEFDKKKENIGHYGFGEYDEGMSLVVYPDDSSFKVKCKYTIDR